MSTRGCRYLDQQGISYDTHAYDHQIKGARYAAEATGIPLEQMIKTLIIADPPGSRFWFALLPGHVELNLKSAARAVGVKKLRMATTEEAERTSGYQVGGISPFGARNEFPVLLEKSLTTHTMVGINGGARGVIVSMKPSDLIQLLDPLIVQLN